MNIPKIDRAKAADIAQILPLLDTLFALEEDFEFKPANVARALKRILDDGERSCLLVARSDERIVGMCSVQLVISTAEGTYSAWVEDVIVDSTWRGQGVGSLLLEGLEQWCRDNGATRMQLVADRNNDNALGFYRHTGWSELNLYTLKKKI